MAFTVLVVMISPNGWLAPYTNFFTTFSAIASASSLLLSIPEIVCFLTFSNSSVLNAGCKTTSDIIPNNAGKLDFNDTATALVLEVERLPPKYSTASSTCSFVFVVVPLFTNWPAMSAKPALSPSLNPSRSKFKLAITLGNLVFLTTNTFKPLGKVNLTGLPTWIMGALPGAGALVLSIFWAKAAIGNRQIIILNTFFIIW